MRCPRCDDHGLVLFDQLIQDGTLGAERKVQVAYRCLCAAGSRFSARIAVEPVEPPAYVLPRRRDVDGEP
jgi:hypothetical protein